MRHHSPHPIVVIGAGPVGLAAAVHLRERGLEPIVLEAGPHVGAAVAQWGHVRLFTPWRDNIDPVARRLLTETGWTAPPDSTRPTGADLVTKYLKPLAAIPSLTGCIHTSTTVVAVSRRGIDKVRNRDRTTHPYLVRTVDGSGHHTDYLATAVIDASGTWRNPNPLGTAGLPAQGESDSFTYKTGPLPDVAGADRARFAGKRVLVVGAGHSAGTTLLALAELAKTAPGTVITWTVRGNSMDRLYGGPDVDVLPARGELGANLKALVAKGVITLVRGVTLDRLVPSADGPVTVFGRVGAIVSKMDVDVIVAATGFRPDLDMLREVRLDLDPGVEAPAALAPLIDPDFHNLDRVPPHGERDLRHPDTGFYIVGVKSYGRAPDFLMAAGYEQVRSIAAALAGDTVAAEPVVPRRDRAAGAVKLPLQSEIATGHGIGRATAMPVHGYFDELDPGYRVAPTAALW